MATLLQDTFTDTDATNLTAHTMDVGGGWTEHNGAFTIQSNKAAPPANTENAVDSAEASDASVTITLVVDVPNANNYALGIALRITDQNNHWQLIVQRDSAGTAYLNIQERNTGTSTPRSTQNFSVAPTNTTITLTATCTGDTITLAASTGESCQYTSASFNNTATKHGIFSYTAFGYAAGAFNDFLVDSVVGAAATNHDLTLLGVGA